MDDRNQVQRSTQESTDPETLLKVTAKQIQVEDERIEERLAESQGWALKWDGSALSEIQERQNERRSFSTTDED